MFGEVLSKIKTSEFPKNLETMSIEELESYIDDLKSEISRCEDDINAKKASKDVADSVFK